MSKKATQAEDQEIDLSTITKNIGNAFQDVNSFVFQCIQFFLRNIIFITVLILIGVGLGFYLDETQKTYDHKIIVTPNFGSVDYLYNKIDLINSKIKESDTLFLKSIGIQQASKLSKIEIQPIIDVYRFINNNEQNYEVLKLMADEGDVKKIVEDRPSSKNYTYHVISFTTKRMTSHEKTVKPLIAYLNSSDFYRMIQKESVNNVRQKIVANDLTISQINGVLNEFSKNVAEGSAKGSSLVYYNENSQLNDVIKTKEDLTDEQGNHRITLVSLDKIVKDVSAIINIENTKSVNGKLKLILQLVLLLAFILLNGFTSFNKKEKKKLSNT